MQLRRFMVVPAIPPALAPLQQLAMNLWWSWHAEARALFARIDHELYEKVVENPLALLAQAPRARLEALAKDDAFLAEMARVRKSLDDYLAGPTWFDREAPFDNDARVAYFSMEFGIHECLPVYSGGLGVLAG